MAGQDVPVFDFNRPPAAAATIPLPLLHPVFGQFIDDCESRAPTKEDNHLVHDLSLAMSEFFSSEEARMSKFREVMNGHGFDLTASTVEGTSYRTDGDTRIGGFCTLIVEGKLEIAGSGGAEPLFQGALYNLAKESIHTLPCFILYVFGEYLRTICFNFGSEPRSKVLTLDSPVQRAPFVLTWRFSQRPYRSSSMIRTRNCARSQHDDSVLLKMQFIICVYITKLIFSHRLFPILCFLTRLNTTHSTIERSASSLMSLASQRNSSFSERRTRMKIFVSSSYVRIPKMCTIVLL